MKEEIKKKEVEMVIKQAPKQALIPVIQVRVGRRGSTDMTAMRHARLNIKNFQEDGEEIGLKEGRKGKEEKDIVVVQNVSRRRWSVDMMSSSPSSAGAVNTEKSLPLVRRSAQRLLAPLSQLSLQTDMELEDEPMDEHKEEEKEEGNKEHLELENVIEKSNVLREKVPSISRLQGIKKKVSQRAGQLTASALEEKPDVGCGEKSSHPSKRDAKMTNEDLSSLWTDSLSQRFIFAFSFFLFSFFFYCTDLSWLEVELLLRKPIKSKDDYLYVKTSAEAGLIFIDQVHLLSYPHLIDLCPCLVYFASYFFNLFNCSWGLSLALWMFFVALSLVGFFPTTMTRLFKADNAQRQLPLRSICLSNYKAEYLPARSSTSLEERIMSVNL